MLGSAQGAIGGDEAKIDIQKLKIIRRDENFSRKDEAKIKFNYQDFLSRNENLTDQCRHFVESLSLGTQECLICANIIY